MKGIRYTAEFKAGEMRKIIENCHAVANFELINREMTSLY